MLFSNIIDEYVDISEGAGHGALSLSYGFRMLREYDRIGDKVFLWIGVADVDVVGHKAGGLSKEYNESIRNILYLLLDFISRLEEAGLANNTLLVVLNDHGFKKMGHHGGPEPEVRRVFLLLIGPGIRPGIYNTPFTHNDIAPTISMLMGWRAPSNSIGKSDLSDNISVYMVFTGAEEVGLLGSHYFRRFNPHLFPDAIVINVDNPGSGRLYLTECEGVVLTWCSNRGFRTFIRELAKSKGIDTIVYKLLPTDATPLMRSGFKVTSLMAFDNGMIKNYHWYNDTVDGVDPRNLTKARDIYYWIL
jgi:hypothetical protein